MTAKMMLRVNRLAVDMAVMEKCFVRDFKTVV